MAGGRERGELLRTSLLLLTSSCDCNCSCSYASSRYSGLRVPSVVLLLSCTLASMLCTRRFARAHRPDIPVSSMLPSTRDCDMKLLWLLGWVTVTVLASFCMRCFATARDGRVGQSRREPQIIHMGHLFGVLVGGLKAPAATVHASPSMTCVHPTAASASAQGRRRRGGSQVRTDTVTRRTPKASGYCRAFVRPLSTRRLPPSSGGVGRDCAP